MDLVTRTSFDPMDVRKGDQVVVLPGASLWWPANPGFRISTVWIAAVCIVQGVIDESAEAIELGYDPEPPAVWIVAKWGPPPALAFVNNGGWVPLGQVHDRFGARRTTSGLLAPKTLTPLRPVAAASTKE